MRAIMKVLKYGLVLSCLMVHLISQDFKTGLENLLKLRAAELSGLSLAGEKLTRAEHREYYYNLLMENALKIRQDNSLSEDDKVYLVSFSKALAINAKKGYDKEAGVDLKELKKELLPIFLEIEGDMESLLAKPGSQRRADYYALLAVIKIDKAGFLPFTARFKYFSQSKKLFEKSFAIDSRESSALLGLALSYYFPPALFGGNLKKAFGFLDRILDDQEKGQSIKYLAYVWKSQAYLKQKNKEKAKDMLREASKIFPQGGLLLFASDLLEKGKRIGG